MTARVLIRPKQGILDPQGQAVERALPALGFEGVTNVRVGRLIELEVDDPAQVPEMCERLLANPLVEDYEVLDHRDLGQHGMRFGVLRFPGSCDEVDALQACRRYADAELIWHGDRDLGGVDAVVVPGGFSYGDYLRVGAIARFSPAMDAVADFARSGGPVLGICNGFQVLCEAGLLPGAPAPEHVAALRLPPGGRGGGERGHPVHARVRGGTGALDPGEAHHRPLLGAPGDPRGAGGRRPGDPALRPGPEPQRVAAGHRRGGQRARGT